MTRLSVSVVLPATAATASRDSAAFARHAEQADLDGIFTGDHLAAAAPRLDASNGGIWSLRHSAMARAAVPAPWQRSGMTTFKVPGT